MGWSHVHFKQKGKCICYNEWEEKTTVKESKWEGLLPCLGTTRARFTQIDATKGGREEGGARRNERKRVSIYSWPCQTALCVECDEDTPAPKGLESQPFPSGARTASAEVCTTRRNQSRRAVGLRYLRQKHVSENNVWKGLVLKSIIIVFGEIKAKMPAPACMTANCGRLSKRLSQPDRRRHEPSPRRSNTHAPGSGPKAVIPRRSWRWFYWYYL